MKVLALCKASPQGKSLVSRPYGRFHLLPEYLAQNGLHLNVAYLASAPLAVEPAANRHYDIDSPISLRAPLAALAHIQARASQLQPDLVIGFSDTWYGILAAHLARRTGAKLLLDAYDNYEGYIPWAKPLHWAWRRALSQADAITAAGPQLLSLMQRSNPNALARVVPMCADRQFRPQEITQARAALGLPQGRKLVGYLGTADKTRGFDVFGRAMAGLMAERDDFDVVISGRSAIDLPLPAHRVHTLGYLADELMPALNNSCDLLMCLNRDSAFGNYSYPVKIYEALACQRPILASDTAPVRWILNSMENALVPVGDAGALARKTATQLDRPQVLPAKPGWDVSGALFLSVIEETLSRAS